MSISKRLQKELKDDTRSIYRIWKLTGVDRAILKRFRDGERSIDVTTADKLADFYNLKLRKTK